jgi:transcriptional regulator with XRE-family HTH domain
LKGAPHEWFGANLRRARERAGLTRRELAGRTGVSRTYVGRLEDGRGDPSLSAIWAFGEALNIAPASLLEPPESPFAPAPDRSKTEEWRDVEGYEGLYSVSSLGRVRSHGRVVRMRDGRARRVAPRIMSPGPAGSGRERVRLTLVDREGARRSASVAVLVARAFLGPPLPGTVVLHRDDDPENNRAGNLRHGRSAEAIEAGTPRKLTEAEVRAAREALREEGANPRRVALRMGLGEGVVRNLAKGKTYRGA